MMSDDDDDDDDDDDAVNCVAVVCDDDDGDDEGSFAQYGTVTLSSDKGKDSAKSLVGRFLFAMCPVKNSRKQTNSKDNRA